MIINSAMISKSNVKPASLIGHSVKVISASGDFASIFIGNTGIVTSLCGLYKGAVVVRMPDDYFVSYYPCELQVN